MRFKELISEEVAPAEIDWQQFAAVLAATAKSRVLPRGIDGIVYLGIIGDPSNTNLEVRFKRKVSIGLDMSPDTDNAYILPGGMAQYHHTDDEFKGRDIAGANGLQVGRDFDILVSWSGRSASDWATKKTDMNFTIAHELMHRGFAIADHIPDIKSLMSGETRGYLENRRQLDVPGVLNSADLEISSGAFMPFTGTNKKYATLEHMMIYATLFGSISMQSDIVDRPSNYTRMLADIKKFRKIYLDIESAVRQYVLSYPAPKGSLLALRDELSGETPGYNPVVVADTKGTPTLTLVPDEKQTASTKINGSGTTTAWAPKSVTTSSFSGDPVKGVGKKTAPSIKYKGWTLSDN